MAKWIKEGKSESEIIEADALCMDSVHVIETIHDVSDLSFTASFGCSPLLIAFCKHKMKYLGCIILVPLKQKQL